MAKKGSSASASASTSASTKSKMVLRVKSGETKKASEGVKQTKKGISSKKKISKIDAMKPKKPPTAFFYFLEDFRKEFQEQNPDVKSMRDIGKACGEKWKTMTYERLDWSLQMEKVHYYDVATEKRREFDRAMADFNKRKENGEFQEYEEDSDFDE